MSPAVRCFQQLSKNLLNLSGHFAELQVHNAASMESYCACLVPTQVRCTVLELQLQWLFVNLEVPLSSAASVILYKQRHLLSFLTEAV